MTRKFFAPTSRRQLRSHVGLASAHRGTRCTKLKKNLCTELFFYREDKVERSLFLSSPSALSLFLSLSLSLSLSIYLSLPPSLARALSLSLITHRDSNFLSLSVSHSLSLSLCLSLSLSLSLSLPSLFFSHIFWLM